MVEGSSVLINKMLEDENAPFRIKWIDKFTIKLDEDGSLSDLSPGMGQKLYVKSRQWSAERNRKADNVIANYLGETDDS